jgi:hypothetical protein
MARHVSDHEGLADPMTVVAIHLGAPQNPRLWTVESVEAIAGEGLEGDRHFDPTGAPPEVLSHSLRRRSSTKWGN